MLAQVFTGHGVFGKYLKRIRVERSSECWFCNEREDTPEHTLWECPEWEGYRAEARAGGLDLNRSTIGNELVESKSKWVAFEGLIENILRAKTVRENERKKSGVRSRVRT
ncbi:uncharacterized protein [Euwallacea fornicatus]|uniref:uncharacterized protein n=1 Tax=Euwallacea fornicatus TaxID=995702 RepID=UPI00338DCEDF